MKHSKLFYLLILVLVLFSLISFLSCKQIAKDKMKKTLNEFEDVAKEIDQRILQRLKESGERLALLNEDIVIRQNSKKEIPMYLKNDLNGTLIVDLNSLNVSSDGGWISGSGAKCYASEDNLLNDKINISIVIKPSHLNIPPNNGSAMIMDIHAGDVSGTFYCVAVVSYENKIYASKDFIVEVK